MVAGVSIGAGMLALPIAAATIGPVLSLILMLLVAALMLYAGLVTAEVNFTLGESLSIAKMGEKCFGKGIYLVGIFTVIILFYSLVSAYLSGMTSIIQKNIISQELLQFDTKIFSDGAISTIIGLIIASIVFTSTKAVDYSNRLFFSVKFILLGSLLVMLLPYVKGDFVLGKNLNINWHNMLLIVPIFFTSFGFHGSIPSILKYVGHEKRDVVQIFTLGVSLPYIVYALWITVTIGSLPPEGEHSLHYIQTASDGLSALFSSIAGITGSTLVSYIVAGFSWCMITSLLGVTLGLVDFFIEICGYSNSRFDRLKATMWTFFPPMALLLLKSKIFVSALAFASIALSILAILIPCASSWYLINKGQAKHFYYAKKPALICLMAFGCSVIVMGATALS